MGELFIMRYEELGSEQKMHVNGVISKFMDNYIRNNLIWTPEQMYAAFYKEIDAQHRSGWYGCKQMVNGEWIFPYYEGNSWLTTSEAKDYIMQKFATKYVKNNKLARKDSPLVERARFGLKWDEQLFYDINWGLKNGYDFEKTITISENVKVTFFENGHLLGSALILFQFKYKAEILKGMDNLPNPPRVLDDMMFLCLVYLILT